MGPEQASRCNGRVNWQPSSISEPEDRRGETPVRDYGGVPLDCAVTCVRARDDREWPENNQTIARQFPRKPLIAADSIPRAAPGFKSRHPHLFPSPWRGDAYSSSEKPGVGLGRAGFAVPRVLPAPDSTKHFRRPKACSHWRETTSRYLLASSSGPGANVKRISRPWRMPWTRPAFSMTRRCFVIAWRVSLDPSESSEIDSRAPLQSLHTSRRRVSSPRAAKTGVCSPCPGGLPRLGLGDMGFDALHLSCPALVVLPEGFGPPTCRNLVKP